MRSPLRVLLITLFVGLLGASSAQAVIQDTPQFTLSPFTRAQTGAGNAVSATLTWLPPTFLGAGPSSDKQAVVVTDLDGGSPQTFAAGATTASFPLLLSDGHRYSITVAACQTATCVLGSVNTAETTGTTRIDATPPSGTVQINGGAAATNNRTVTLNLAATDPLIGGVPGTSSGVTQSATDVDGDGTTPCILFGGSPDSSGCAVSFSPTVSATIPAGDGVKTVGVRFGDGARVNTSPCPPGILCATLLGSFIDGNASAMATDTILLDTVKPIGLATQDRFSIERGGSVSFDASTSLDTGPVTPSGIDPAATTWAFKDGTAPATGAKVSHVFNQVGTFVGELRVRDRAGNLSDARAFSVTVNPGPGGTATGGSVVRVTGTAAFTLDRLNVRARYVQSRLKGSVTLRGTSTLAGPLRAELRRTARGRLLAKVVAKRLEVGAFTRTLKLPANLLPGTYRLALIGPGGTLRSTLKLAAPREGVLKRGRLLVTGGRATALFTLAAQPAKALRGRLTVSWSQGSRNLGQVSVTSSALIRAALPAGASLAAGRLRAVLRAGGVAVGSAGVPLR